MDIYRLKEKVEILRKDIYALRRRERPLYGTIEGIDGEYIDVCPEKCDWIIELYRSEIRKLEDRECISCDLRDADCIVHEDRHICMPEKRTGYKVLNGVLETIEIIEGFEDGRE